jgi:hypothetical protein
VSLESSRCPEEAYSRLWGPQGHPVISLSSLSSLLSPSPSWTTRSSSSSGQAPEWHGGRQICPKSRNQVRWSGCQWWDEISMIVIFVTVISSAVVGKIQILFFWLQSTWKFRSQLVVELQSSNLRQNVQKKEPSSMAFVASNSELVFFNQSGIRENFVQTRSPICAEIVSCFERSFWFERPDFTSLDFR